MKTYRVAITATAKQNLRDGTVYLQCGKSHCTIVRIDGLDSIRRLPTTSLTVAANQLR